MVIIMTVRSIFAAVQRYDIFLLTFINSYKMYNPIEFNAHFCLVKETEHGAGLQRSVIISCGDKTCSIEDFFNVLRELVESSNTYLVRIDFDNINGVLYMPISQFMETFDPELPF